MKRFGTERSKAWTNNDTDFTSDGTPTILYGMCLLHHARKAIELAPLGVAYYEFILFFEGNPMSICLKKK
ncbi:hypothetical protein [Exiguobacterium acetylicum]|uniref:hypothetical protein n=1 Tax=Exiguobacterium acetylicum TaxID=41170 RepID=UPI0005549069|nr:hypothetical protein [Exiguobacterium acetylicum]